MSYIQNKLIKLYSDLDRFKESGEDVVADIRAEINNLELQYLKEDVIPEAVKLLAEKISELRCEIDFSLQYNGESNIDYSLITSSSSVLIREQFRINELEVKKSIPEIQVENNSNPIITSDNIETNRVPPLPYNIRIEDYSDTSFVIFGKTNPHAAFFKAHGGIFNPNLRGEAGWILSKRNEEEIRNYLGNTLYLATKESRNHDFKNKSEISKEQKIFSPQYHSDTESIYREFSNQIKNIRTWKETVNGNNSPHKAIMLLAIFEAINCGAIRENKIYLDSLLIARYEKLWKQYLPDEIKFVPNPAATYIHLASEPFFSHVVYKNIENKNQSWTLQQVKKYVQYAMLSDQLFHLIPKKYVNLKNLLIENYLNYSKTKRIGDVISKSLTHQASISEYTTISESEENSIKLSNKSSSFIGYNIIDFKKYMISLKMDNGSKYSSSSISTYSNCLMSAYVKEKARKYTSDGCIFHIISQNDLRDLYLNVVIDAKHNLISKVYTLALKLYLKFINDIQKGSVILSKQIEPIPNVRLEKKHSSVSRSLPHNGKLRKIITQGFSLSASTPTQLMADFIERVGVEKVYDLKIPFLGRLLVDTIRHPKYQNQAKFVNGYWINTCSSTAKKIEQLEEIANQLGIDIKFIAG